MYIDINTSSAFYAGPHMRLKPITSRFLKRAIPSFQDYTLNVKTADAPSSLPKKREEIPEGISSLIRKKGTTTTNRRWKPPWRGR